MPLGDEGTRWNDASMRIVVALGANLGDRLAHLRAGRDFLLVLHHGPAPAAISPVYETEPVDCPPGSAPFLNAIVIIDSTLPPTSLREELATLEEELGRKRGPARNAPRPLDLDIVSAGDLRSNDPVLTLPHPRAHLRRFVLQPLADLDPHFMLPGHTESVSTLLAVLPPRPSVQRRTDSW